MEDWFFSEAYNNKTIISGDDRIGMATYLTHVCPLCKKTGSAYRSIVWILDSCIYSGDAQFPCDSCGQTIIFPPDVFNREFMEDVKKLKEKHGHNFWWDGKMYSKTPNQLFVSNWPLVLRKSNRKGIASLFGYMRRKLGS